MKKEVLISSVSEDAQVCHQIVQFLESEGISCWCRPRDLSTGVAEKEAVENAMAEARVVVVVLSAKANVSRVMQNEIQHAFDDQKLIIPIRIEALVPQGAIELLSRRRFVLEATVAPLEPHLRELVRIVRPLMAQKSKAHEEASISRTLPPRTAVLLGGEFGSPAVRESAGPFQVAIRRERVAHTKCVSTVEVVVINESPRTLRSVEIEFECSAFKHSEKRSLSDLAPGAEARVSFEVMPRMPGNWTQRFAVGGCDDVMRFSYIGSLTMRVSDTPDETIPGRARKIESVKPPHLTNVQSREVGPENSPASETPDGFSPLELALDYAHALKAESVLQSSPSLRIPFAFLGQRQAGTLLTFEALENPSQLPHQDIRLSAGTTFTLGRSREEGDYVLWFWPRNEIHDAKTIRISKKQCTLAAENGELVIRSAARSTITTLDDQLVTEVGLKLEKRGTLNIAGNYFLDVLHVAPEKTDRPSVTNLDKWVGPVGDDAPLAQGCVRFVPLTANVLPQHSTWLLTAGTFGTSRINPIVFAGPDLAEVQGRFHYFQGCFWLENLVDNGAVRFDDQDVKPGALIPLISGKILVLGGRRYKARIRA